MMIAVNAELAACVFVCEAKAAARAYMLEALEPEHFAQSPCADWWREAKRLEADGEGPAGWNVLERLISAKASVPASPDGWRGWWLTIREQAAGYLERGRLDNDERAEELVRELTNAHELRELRRVCAEVAGRAEGMAENGEQLRAELLERVTPRVADGAQGLISTKDAANELLERLTARTVAATPSPWPGLDACVQLSPGSLTVLAAATGVGKTVLAIQYARACAAAGSWCMFVGLEMPASANLARVARQEYGCEHRPEVLPPQLQSQAYAELIRGISSLVGEGLRVEWSCDAGQSTDHVAMRAKAFKARLEERGERLGLIVVDYLGILDPTGDDARRRMEKHELLGEYARRLKILARTIGAPVLALAQLNREAEKAGAKATRGMIGDSYAILRHADTVLLFSRPLPGAEPGPQAEPALSIQKARDGRAAFFRMTWDSARETYSMTP